MAACACEGGGVALACGERSVLSASAWGEGGAVERATMCGGVRDGVVDGVEAERPDPFGGEVQGARGEEHRPAGPRSACTSSLTPACWPADSQPVRRCLSTGAGRNGAGACRSPSPPPRFLRGADGRSAWPLALLRRVWTRMSSRLPYWSTGRQRYFCLPLIVMETLSRCHLSWARRASHAVRQGDSADRRRSGFRRQLRSVEGVTVGYPAPPGGVVPT